MLVWSTLGWRKNVFRHAGSTVRRAKRHQLDAHILDSNVYSNTATALNPGERPERYD
ncbi:hypothetical protein MCEGE14_00838 [Burkholderiaceae bacterium]